MSPLLAAGGAVVTLSPVATEDHGSTEARRPATDGSADVPPGGERHRPTGWIVLCGLLLLAVAGLAVWGFSAQSDADDAQAKLDAQQRAAAEATPAPTAEPAQPAQLDPETQQKFEALAEELGAAGESVEQIEQELEQASAKVEEAEQLRQDAQGVLDSARAEAEAFKAQFELTKTCLRGTLDAVAAAYAGGDLAAAVQELEKLSGNCRSSASS
jgi:uncharacterized iron-regulated membrane protein